MEMLRSSGSIDLQTVRVEFSIFVLFIASRLMVNDSSHVPRNLIFGVSAARSDTNQHVKLQKLAGIFQNPETFIHNMILTFSYPYCMFLFGKVSIKKQNSTS